ncbi:MAG: hypothetical protein ACI8RD_012955 [Bacillariaceae sp.]|jgi:hypothetical protein
MFAPLKMMIAKTTTRNRTPAVHESDSESSGPDYSSPESDNDNDDDDDDDMSSTSNNKESRGKQRTPIATKTSVVTKTVVNNNSKQTKTPSPESSTTNNFSPSALASVSSPSFKEKTNLVDKNDKTATKNSSKKKQTKVTSKSPTNGKGMTGSVTTMHSNDTTVVTGNTTSTDQLQQLEKGSVAPITAEKAPPPPNKKKRLTLFEQLDEESQLAGETLKAVTEELLKYKRAAHASLLRDIKEKEKELTRLKESAIKAEKDIEETLEKKKKASKCSRDLKSKCAKVISKAVEEKDRAKAKDAELKQVLKKRSLDGTKEEEETKSGSAKKKRRVTMSGKKKKKKRSTGKEDSSDDESNGGSDNDNDGDDGNDSDADDDSDYEGGGPRGKKSSQTTASPTVDETPSSTRKTRVRSNKWNCERCTFINVAMNKECVACELPKPGELPDLD